MGNRQYLTAGNLWLAAALVLWLGRKAVRFEPTRYAFFGAGAWLSPAGYGFLIVACLLVGTGFVILGQRASKVSSPR